MEADKAEVLDEDQKPSSEKKIDNSSYHSKEKDGSDVVKEVFIVETVGSLQYNGRQQVEKK